MADSVDAENGEVTFDPEPEQEDRPEADASADDSLLEHVDNGDDAHGGGDDVGDNDQSVDDPELEAIKARVREMEEEAEKLKQMQNEVEKQLNMSPPSALASPAGLSLEDKIDADNRSIYVGNVDYSATAEELEAHFHGCGSVNRVTILCDKFTGHPKGFAYIEFADKDSVTTAQALDESLFKGRQIKVLPKRTNRPGVSSTNRPPFRGRGSRGRGWRYYGSGGYSRSSSRSRPRRGGSWFSPY
ncbi:PREDICTED: polyadenylate-binding protein 2-like [Priapulus caudatus]|uniref:Polyadenylate-binding protein 2-like n=1 Tax=Priapulus caudatus TaxID=37621 RepID=A0ABM1EYT1_PRICU|nr:PREDICTED: polyadenylate-binding protein 2-like [Priapulus caudatus]XP_014677353.1 PREDICTED: polyadenylate-binding protein 2-like [Priapulus caudatus]